MKNKIAGLWAVLLLMPLTALSTELAGKSQFDPRQTFAPLKLPDPVNRYRSADGSPGPDYWQNKVDYEIHATLDTTKNQLNARETISYTNNSPDVLESLWIHLDQNIYQKDSRRSRASGKPRKSLTAGYVLDDVKVEDGAGVSIADYLIDGTRMQIRLKHPLASGGSLQIHFAYHYEIPGEGGGRTAWADSKNGKIYDIAQWYPRMAVYDDLRGWDTLPYVGSEFYLEYGNIDYYVTVPWDMLVAGSGALQNPREVLTKTQRQRLKRAHSSDDTIIIRGADEITMVNSRPVEKGTLTWHYRMENTRDVAFSASRAFIWDAARMRLQGNKNALAMSYYPIESDGEAAWGRSTEYLKHAVETFSKQWSVYPYPAAINAAGKVSGMEYPGILFDGMNSKGKVLFWLTAHEIGHNWFPMVVGTNERRHAWMDEGFNTFIDVYESDAFEEGIYGPKRDSEYAPGGGNPVEEIQALMADPDAPTIMMPADTISEKYRHPVSYFKTALGLILLREQILGPERFDWAFRKFIRDWSFRHPSPSDFFRTMNSAAGEDLSWYWRGWFMNNWQLDLAVESVVNGESASDKPGEISIANLGQLVMPVQLKVTFKDGSSQQLALPVETWRQNPVLKLQLDTAKPVSAVVIDPDALIPDRDRSNNSWEASY